MLAPLDCPGFECWQALFANQVTPEQRERYERHLESCPACQACLDRAEEGGDGLLRLVREIDDPTVRPADPTLAQVLEQLHQGKGLDQLMSGEPADLYFLHPSDRPDLLGTLGAYEVQEVIGQGGMGVVLKAFEPALHRLVAIKVLAAAVAGSATARRRFTREAQAAAAICHEHVVTVHGVHETDALPYLVMQYVAGESVQARLDRSGALELTEIVRIGLQTASGLAAAHAQGLIHRDIKPANLLLENGVARVKITDFGLARMADDVRLTQNGVVAGTPEYMAPEQARGETVDHRADLFSLGSVLYAMSTGVAPFRGATAVAVLRQVSDVAPRPVRSLNPDVPAWLEALIARLLAKDPAERFQSATEVAALLEGYLAHLREPATVPVPQLPPSALAGVSGSRSWALVRRGLLLTALGLCAALVVGLALRRPGASGGPVPSPEPAPPSQQEYYHSLKGLRDKVDGLTLFGPDAQHYVHFEPEGLRITLPAGHPGQRSANGVITTFGMEGDFQVTVNFEVLHEPEREEAGQAGTRFTLDAGVDRRKDIVATLSRKWTPKGDCYLTWLSLGKEAGGEERKKSRTFFRKGKTGRLGLVRSGDVISYCVAEDLDGEFTVLEQCPFTSASVKDVFLIGTTGGPRAALDVRFTDLRIRARSLRKPSMPLPQKSEPVSLRRSDGRDVATSPNTAKYAQEYYEPLTACPESGHGLKRFGPNAAQCVKFEPAGLRITLPEGLPSPPAGTGVVTTFAVKGDFEITLSFEVLKQPEPAAREKSGLSLGVRMNPHDATVGRGTNNKGLSTFAAWSSTRADGHATAEQKLSWFPSSAMTGRVRLVRTGTVLSFYIAEGFDGAFVLLQQSPWSAEDVKAVRLVGSTGSPRASFDVRVTDLRIRADSLPNWPEAASQQLGGR